MNNPPPRIGIRSLPDRYVPLDGVTLTNARVVGQLTYDTVTAIPIKGLFGTRWCAGQAVVDFNNNEGQYEATRVAVSHRVFARTGESLEQVTRLPDIPAEAHALVAAFRSSPVAYDVDHPEIGNGRLTALDVTADITYGTHEIVTGAPSQVLPLRLRARHGFGDDQRTIGLFLGASMPVDTAKQRRIGDGARLTGARVGLDGTLSNCIVTKVFPSVEMLPGWLTEPLAPYFVSGEKSH